MGLNETKYAYMWCDSKRVNHKFHLYIIRNTNGQEVECLVDHVTNIPPTLNGTHPEQPNFAYMGKVVRWVCNL